MSSFVEVAEQAARAGGRVLLDWMPRFQIREKGPRDLVTEADVASQDAVWDVLRSHFPTHGLLGEEGADIRGEDARYRWIVDPLDGTTNYAHKIPQFAVSIALACDDQIVAACVFDPIPGECFTAARGEGARLNGQPIRVSDIESLERALVVCSFPAHVRRGDVEIERFLNVLVNSQSLRRSGSAALNLAYVACGRFDGYWATTCKAWDVAAGFLLVEEAGGRLTRLDGGTVDVLNPRFVVSNGTALHEALRAQLQVEKSD